MTEFIVPDANLLIWLDKTEQVEVLMEHFNDSIILVSKKVLSECQIESKELLVSHSNVSIKNPANTINKANLVSRPSEADLEVLTLGKEKSDSKVISDDPDVWKNSGSLEIDCLKLLEFLKELRKETIDSEDFHFKAGVAHEDLRLPKEKVEKVREWERNF